MKCSVILPEYSNIKKITREENQSDILTYKWYIESITDNFFDIYDTVYFINSSCIGPFMPTICHINWIDSMNYFLQEYSMIGPIIEVPPDNLGFLALGLDSKKNIPFIHSYMFGVNKFGFSIIKNILKDIDNSSKIYIVNNIERALTSSILLNGGKIKTLLARFKLYDINEEKRWLTDIWNIPGQPTCYEIPNNYFGIDVNPFEIIFVKNIRNTNETRGKSYSGISTFLKKYIDNYVKWL
jgi:hypothetical protein